MATANLGRVGFVNKGTYSGATTYKINDVVTYNTGTYACIQANTGQAPTNTSYWQNWVSDNAVHKTGDETISGVKTLSNNLVFASGTKIQGDFSNATASSRTAIQTSTINGSTTVTAMPNGTGVTSGFIAESSSDVGNSSYLFLHSANTLARIVTGVRGTGILVPLIIQVGAINSLTLDISGNVLVTGSGGLGYGTGSGGTVTQLTSKSTAVTLNKPSGQIIMNGASLAANTTVSFLLFNSLASVNDSLSISQVTGTGSGAYMFSVVSSNGGFSISVRNMSAGALSEALGLNYSIIKGATA